MGENRDVIVDVDLRPNDVYTPFCWDRNNLARWVTAIVLCLIFYDLYRSSKLACDYPVLPRGRTYPGSHRTAGALHSSRASSFPVPEGTGYAPEVTCDDKDKALYDRYQRYHHSI
jgi:hypothetical protein